MSSSKWPPPKANLAILANQKLPSNHKRDTHNTSCSLTIERDKPFLEKNWLTTGEAAIYLGSTPGGVRNRVYKGQLKPRKLYGRLLFKRDELDRLIETSSRRL